MHAALLFDLTAMIGTMVILVISCLWHRQLSSVHDRCHAIGCVTRDLSFAAGLAFAVKMVATVDDVSMMGPYLATSLLMPLYGIAINMSLRIYVRFATKRI